MRQKTENGKEVICAQLRVIHQLLFSFNFQQVCLISVPGPSTEILSVISLHLFLVILNKTEGLPAHSYTLRAWSAA